MDTDNKKIWLVKRSQALIWLREQFPLAFPHVPKPLKIGIHQDIFDAKQEGMPAKRWIRLALKYYVTSYSYLNSLNIGLNRFNLQGLPQGQVNEQEATQAKNELDERKKKNRASP